MAEFIRLYTTRNGRWLSPKFLAGESYGAFRAAGLAQELHDDFGLYLNGIVLVSGVLSFDTLWGTDLSYVTFLPALSEAAAFHKNWLPNYWRIPMRGEKKWRLLPGGNTQLLSSRESKFSQVDADAIAARVSRYTELMLLS